MLSANNKGPVDTTRGKSKLYFDVSTVSLNPPLLGQLQAPEMKMNTVIMNFAQPARNCSSK